MKKTVFLYVGLALMAVCSCVKHDKDFTKEMEENGGSGSGHTPQEFVVKGQVEKGPFISGSVINMQPLNEKMHAVGKTYSATITDNMGTFSFNPEEFSEPYARLSVNGYFYNEYKGALSNGQITLQSVVDLRDKSSVNVNLLTHLKYQRVLNLIKDGASFSDANAQAQEELLKSFGLQKLNTADVSQFSVAAGTDEAAALIVTSALLLSNRTEAQFTEYLAKLCKDFAVYGKFSDENKEQISQDKMNIASKLEDIRNALINRYSQLNRAITVKDLVDYVDWDENGIAGDEAHDPDKPATFSMAEILAPAEGGTFNITYESDVKLFLHPLISNSNSMPEMIHPSLTAGKISCTSEMTGDNTLTVTVGSTSYQEVIDSQITLYDLVGNTVATIPVRQTGNPDGTWFTADGMLLFRDIKDKLIWDPDRLDDLLNGKINNYLDSNSPDVTVYHLDDVLMGYWFLGKVMENHISQIEDSQELKLKLAIANLSEQQPMGYCETEYQLARMSSDVIRYALAKYYYYTAPNLREEIISLLEPIVNNSVYSNSYPILGVDNHAIISYYDVSELYRRNH